VISAAALRISESLHPRVRKHCLPVLCALALPWLGGCELLAPKPSLLPLEIQALQTREYEQPREIVFNSVVSVFQDLGYIIRSADGHTGLVTAESPAQSGGLVALLGITSVQPTNVTAFIETLGKYTRVRLNFVNSVRESSSYGQTDRRDTPLLDAQTYRNAFERIENAIFVRSGR